MAPPLLLDSRAVMALLQKHWPEASVGAGRWHWQSKHETLEATAYRTAQHGVVKFQVLARQRSTTDTSVTTFTFAHPPRQWIEEFAETFGLLQEDWALGRLPMLRNMPQRLEYRAAMVRRRIAQGRLLYEL